MSATARQRRWRDRQALGRVVVSVEFDEDELLETLTVGGLLDPSRSDDSHAVAEALKRQVDVLHWLARHNRMMLRILPLLVDED